MNSDGHRANLLDRQWCYFGCGMTEGGAYDKNWVQLFSTGGGVMDAITNTGSFHFDTIADMEMAYLICDVGEGIKAYVPLDEDYMVRNGNQYTIHLMGKSVTVTVADIEK